MRKTSPRQVLCALDRVVGMDMRNFSHMLQTGRYINDYHIVRAMNTGTIGEAVRAVSDYGHFDAAVFAREGVPALKKKGYITPPAITRAKQIKKYAVTKTRIKTGAIKK